MIKDIVGLKNRSKIVMLTGYDYQTAAIMSRCPVDLILVGDTLGVVFQGNDSTHTVTMEEMLYHTRAVVRGAGQIPVIGDMPIHTYDTPQAGLAHARRFVEAGAAAVKLEGYNPGLVAHIVRAGIPVMGHLGLLPQTAANYKVVGKDPTQAARLKSDAALLAAEGAFSIVLECVPESLAREITAAVNVPTIGIGAGVYCDGQVLVINDLLGMDTSVPAKFVKRYADLASVIAAAVTRYADEVRTAVYPDERHTYH